MIFTDWNYVGCIKFGRKYVRSICHCHYDCFTCITCCLCHLCALNVLSLCYFKSTQIWSHWKFPQCSHQWCYGTVSWSRVVGKIIGARLAHSCYKGWIKYSFLYPLIVKIAILLRCSSLGCNFTPPFFRNSLVASSRHIFPIVINATIQLYHF